MQDNKQLLNINNEDNNNLLSYMDQQKMSNNSSQNQQYYNQELSPNQQVDQGNFYQLSLQNDIPQLKDQLSQLEQQMREQEENHRQQIMHLETIGMMTKYQLVFIKLESSLNKLANLLNMRQTTFKTLAFRQLQIALQNKKVNNNHQAKLIYFVMEKRTTRLNNILQKVVTQNMFNSFQKIMLVSRLKNYDNKLKIEHEKIKKEFANILQQKEDEIQNLVNQREEQNSNINLLKSKETDNQIVIKQKDQLISSLEQELEVKRQKKLNPQDLVLSTKILEKKLKDLEIENNEMREKSQNTEGSVSLFIKEMNELLDQHEISTNIGSDDNFSLNNSNSNYQHNQIQNAIYNSTINPNNFNEFEDAIDTQQFNKKNLVQNPSQNKQNLNKVKLQTNQVPARNLLLSSQGTRQAQNKN
ncbi:hypothetical protein ABPG72_010334 [Tetrahymena utriculariae]